mgnify:FL=1
MEDDNPTNRELVFAFIVDYKRRHDGLSPGIREIAAGCHLSQSTVKYHLFMLERANRIHIEGRARIQVIGGVWDLPGY